VVLLFQSTSIGPALKKSFVMPGLKQNRVVDESLNKLLPEPNTDYDMVPEKSGAQNGDAFFFKGASM
jgi:hypothetical protein